MPESPIEYYLFHYITPLHKFIISVQIIADYSMIIFLSIIPVFILYNQKLYKMYLMIILFKKYVMQTRLIYQKAMPFA